MRRAEREHLSATAVGVLAVASALTSLETDPERKAKKRRVVTLKLRLIREAFPEEGAVLRRSTDARRFLRAERPDEEARALLIDLAFTDPYAPYELAYKQSDHTTALFRVGQVLGLEEEDVTRIRAAQRDVLRAHRHIDWTKIAACGLGGALVVAGGGWLLAPAIGGALGGLAGLSGAAATAHGLALLGGGSLAVGGWGMAGGMWLVTGVGAATGLVGGAAPVALTQLGAASMKVELMKLQVSFRENILGTQLEIRKGQAVVERLALHRDEMIRALNEERCLNDKNAARLRDIEAKVVALEDAVRWMEREVPDAS